MGPLYDNPRDSVDRERLKTDREYLYFMVNNRLKANDKYKSGLITSANFQKALSELGLKFGNKELEDILQHLTITDDGYVHYKDLARLFGKGEPRAKQCTAPEAIFPQAEKLLVPKGQTLRLRAAEGFLGDRAYDIRMLYSMWERSEINDEKFKSELAELGIRITSELNRLLTIYGTSRYLPFAKLMHALQIDENDGRRSRNFQVPETPSETTASERSSVVGVPVRSSPPGQGIRYSRYGRDVPTMSIRDAIHEFLDGSIPGVSFRLCLQSHGVNVSQQLDKVIRQHEYDNSVSFQELARVLRQSEKMGGGGSVRDSLKGKDDDAASNASAPFATQGRWASDPDATIRRRAATPRRDPTESRITGSASGGYPVNPPWATAATVEKTQPRLRPKSTSRAQGHHGDLISWPTQVRTGAEHVRERVLREVDDCFNWDTEAAEAEMPDALQAGCRGKRLFTRGDSASHYAPYGRQNDCAAPMARRVAVPVPFGTDRDSKLRRPEEAGTDEYRFVGDALFDP